MAIVNSNYEFIMVDVGAKGRMSDGGVIANTTFGHLMKNNELNLPPSREPTLGNTKLPFVFVGDEAFALENNFMKPFAQRNLKREERIYNYRLSRARRIVENTFGILAARFRILLTTINLSPKKVITVVLACCYLHNYLRKKQKGQYTGQITFNNVGDLENNNQEDYGELTSLVPTQTKNPTFSAKNTRQKFCNYFNNEGKVSWQDEVI